MHRLPVPHPNHILVTVLPTILVSLGESVPRLLNGDTTRCSSAHVAVKILPWLSWILSESGREDSGSLCK